MTPEALAAGNIFPLGAAVVGALDLVVAWARDGVEPPASLPFTLAEDGSLARDADGNALGGLRLGLLEHPIATFTGSPTGGTLGTMDLFPAERVLAAHPTLASYLAAVDSTDDVLEAAGFLTRTGRREIHAVATEMWRRATGRED